MTAWARSSLPGEAEAKHGDHEARLSSLLDPASMSISCEVRCRRCGWGMQALMGRATSQKMVFEVLVELTRKFRAEVDPDCRTAALLAVAKDVHDS